MSIRRSASLWFCAAAVAFYGASARASASDGRVVQISERIQGAERIVVATAARVTPMWRQNAHGDQLIVSEILLHVEETLKGPHEKTVAMELEGGTLDGFTLHVSSLPELKPGDRAVFLLDRSSDVYVPHQQGLGILRLANNNQVHGTRLLLDDIRRMVLSAGQ